MTAEVLRHLTLKPATRLYPGQPAVMPPNFRGKLVFHPERCSGCKLCQKDCPADAVEIRKVGEKRFEAIFEFDHCIYCAQCVDSCNRGAIESTPEFELASLNRPSLRVTYHALEAPPAAKASPAKQVPVEQLPAAASDGATAALGQPSAPPSDPAAAPSAAADALPGKSGDPPT